MVHNSSCRSPTPPPLPVTHSLARSFSLTLSLSSPFSFSFRCHFLSIIHAVTLTLSHTHSHSDSLSLSLSLYHCHFLSLTHTHTYTVTFTLSITHTHTHTHSHSESLSLSYTPLIDHERGQMSCSALHSHVRVRYVHTRSILSFFICFHCLIVLCSRSHARALVRSLEIQLERVARLSHNALFIVIDRIQIKVKVWQLKILL